MSLAATGSLLGVRETRRISGDYVLSVDDFKRRAVFDDEIGRYCFPVDHNAHVVIEDGILKLRIDEKLPFRPDKSTPCVSCIQTSDHRFGATTAEYQILDKFAQKYGWFEIRANARGAKGL